MLQFKDRVPGIKKSLDRACGMALGLADRYREDILVASLYLVIVLSVMSMYIGLADIGSAVFYNDVSDYIYRLAWNGHALMNDPLGLFNTNSYYPNDHGGAYDPVVFSTSIISLPIYLATGNPVLSYWITVIFAYVFNAFAMYLLAYYHTKSRLASLISGLIIMLCPYMFSYSVNLPFLFIGWMTLFILSFFRLLDKPGWRNAGLLTFFFVMQALSGWHNALFMGVAFILLLIHSLFYRRRKLIAILPKLVSFAVVSTILVAPFALPYIWVYLEEGMQRSIDDTAMQSAIAAEYIIPPHTTVIGNAIHTVYMGSLDEMSRFRHEVWLSMVLTGLRRFLFIGFLPMLLALYAFYRRKPDKTKVFYVMLLVTGFTLSLGPFLEIGSARVPLPYYFIYQAIPLVRFVRVVNRFALLVMISISVLAGIGMDRAIDGKGRDKRMLMAITVSAIILLEYVFILIPNIERVEYSVPGIYPWLAQQDANAIAEIPSSRRLDSLYMVYSTTHWKRMMNGYSSFYYEGYEERMDTVNTFPSQESLQLLREINVTYVFVHSDLYDGVLWKDKISEMLNSEDIELIKEIDGVYVFSPYPASD